MTEGSAHSGDGPSLVPTVEEASSNHRWHGEKSPPPPPPPPVVEEDAAPLASPPTKQRALSDDAVIRIAEATLKTKLEKGVITQGEFDSMVGTHLRMQAAAERERRMMETDAAVARESEVLDLRRSEGSQGSGATEDGGAA